MKNTTICLIRHGEVYNPNNIIYGRSVDVPLTKEGFKQMRSLGSTLKEKGLIPTVIYTSPLTRAKRSAEEIAKIYGNVPIVTDENLLDANTPGLEKFTLDWLKSIGGDASVYKGPETEGIMIETSEEESARVLSVLNKIKKEYSGGTVFIVSHGDPTAFTMWRLQNPTGEIPLRGDLLKENHYLGKGEVWKIEFDEKGKFLDYEFITTREGRSSDREREN